MNPRPSSRPLALGLALTLAQFASASGAGAQLSPGLTRPFVAWRTVRTEHFEIHYPVEMSAWATALAGRIESVQEAVTRLVGNAPQRRVTVLVEDPLAASNGFALPFLDAPLIFVWPTPPTPSSLLGENRGWGEILSVHEFAHLAHLTRPSRNPRQRLLWRFAPVKVGPIAVKSPRWLIEGYATYVEGRLTGSGRPHGAARPAILREWALEGKLPTYGQLNSNSGFYGGAMAYLAGSAFLEWLVERKGERSLVDLWRRMSARQQRDFGDAFAGVYGGRPEDLYGRFTVELTGDALEVRRRLAAAGLAEGETVQKLTSNTGAPAVSRDGTLMTLVIRSERKPSRVVVWKTAPEPESDAERRARARMLSRDPEDVPAVPYEPRPKKPIATLRPVGGRAHDDPRFFKDGERILVSRLEPRGDGTLRPDLFVWSFRTGVLRRVTHGAGVRTADPSPDGRSAAGVRCAGGVCDLVRVNLESGAVVVLARGTPTTWFYRPRFSPSGDSIVVAVQSNGRSRLALVGAAGGAARFVGPDDGANRYDATFLPGGGRLVAVSEAGGIADLEIVDLASGASSPLTRVTSAALAPEPAPNGRDVYFLRLHAKGLDFSRTTLDSAVRGGVLSIDAALSPAAQVPRVAADTFAAAPDLTPRPYGTGPRRFLVLPGGALSPSGRFLSAALASTDPVGRLSWLAQGSYGDRGAWRGGSLGAAWRGTRASLEGEIFAVRQRPSEQRAGTFASAALDARYTGATAASTLIRDFWSSVQRFRAGLSAGALDGPEYDRATRRLAFAELATAHRQTREDFYLAETFAAHGSVGSTGEVGWRRALLSASVAAGRRRSALRGAVSYGAVNRGAPTFEQFVAGGPPAPLTDSAIFSQRLVLPALPVGVFGGSRVLGFRATIETGLLHPYYSALSAGDRLDRWHRLIGAERTLTVPTIAFARLPSVRLTGGVAYSLDEPFRRKTRGYLALGYRP